jgi:hypothetical protein
MINYNHCCDSINRKSFLAWIEKQKNKSFTDLCKAQKEIIGLDRYTDYFRLQSQIIDRSKIEIQTYNKLLKEINSLG